MREKVSAQVIQHHNLDLEKQRAVASAFRLEQELKDYQNRMGTRVMELQVSLASQEEHLSMATADMESFKLNRIQPTRADKSTDVEGLGPFEDKTSNRRASVASVRIPQPKLVKPKKGKEHSTEEDDLMEAETESRDEIAEILPASTRSKGSKPIKPKASPTNRRLSEFHKTPPPSLLAESGSKLKESNSPQAKQGRRNTEFFPNKTDVIPQALLRKADSPPKQKLTETVQDKSEPVERKPPNTSELSPHKESLETKESQSPKESKKSKSSEEDPACTSTRLLPSYSRSRSRSLMPNISFKETLGENERLVSLAQAKAELLSKAVKFDSSISTQSSSNYFFDILGLREKRNIFENSRLKIILREAAGLIKRLEAKLSQFTGATIRTPSDVTGRNYGLVQEMRTEIQENLWVFNLKPEHVIENEVLKDAIVISGRVKTLAGYEDDLISLEHCKDVFTDVKCSIGIDKIAREVETLKKEMEKSVKRSTSAMSKQRWKSILYRSDGSVDVNMSMTGWTPQEKNEIYAEVTTCLLSELDDQRKRFLDEIALLREIVHETERKRSEEEERANRLQALPQTQEALHKKEDYEALSQCVGDMILLLQHLTGADPDSSVVAESFRSYQSSPLADRNLYGNSALIWKKIVKRHREARLKGCEPNSSQRLPESSAGLTASQELFGLANGVKSLVTEAGVMCERLTEKILYPNGINPTYQNPFQSGQESSQLLVGDDAFVSHTCVPTGGQPVNTVLLTPDLIFQSDHLNSEINRHRNAIRSLQERQRSLLNLNLDVMKIDAEKYYSATLQASCASENILKWSSVFAEGSGSLLARELVRRSHSPRPEEGRATDDKKEFPVLERRSLSCSRPLSAQPMPPPSTSSFSSFLALPDYRRKGSPSNLFTPVLDHSRQKRFWKG
jgi:hypothetical protein